MASFLSDPDLVPEAEGQVYQRYLDEAQREVNIPKASILSGIPRPSFASYGPLATLAAIIDTIRGPWPILDVQRVHTELWKLLPEEAKAGHASPSAQRLLDHTLHQCKTSYTSLLDLYHPSSTAAAIIDPESGRSASHDSLTRTVRNFRLPVRHVPGQPKPVVAISLPNGPLLAMTVLATATYYTAAPVAHGSGVGKEQFKADVLQSKSDVVLAAQSDIERLGLRDAWLAESGLCVLLVDLSDDMALIVRQLDGSFISLGECDSPATAKEPVEPTTAAAAVTGAAKYAAKASSAKDDLVNTADDIGIMLFTSGTSGTKKLVPLRIHSMVCGVAMVVESWGLSREMRCLNQMPLNHVGGLIRNLFAPVFSAGSVICCSAFDANLFWDCVEDYGPTWYYASPSMHQVILEAGSSRPDSVAKSQIKLICNAAGGLLPSLALRLRETFSTPSKICTVLPSYGMTECMPISTPPLDYRLDRTGTSGISVGPEIAILDGRDRTQPTVGEVGRIAVRGAPVFGGYLKDNNVIDKSCFTENGWFDTGDMGYLDKDGYLYITGRSKEVINRGGELISPFEVEEAIVAAASRPDTPIYGRISKALAFSVTHDVLQEVVGLAVVTPDGAKRACLRSIQEAVKSNLSQVKLPVILVYMDGGLPTNNNKVLRIKLADRLALPEVSDSTPPAGRYFEACCPPANTPLSTPISSKSLQFSHQNLSKACSQMVPEAYDFHIRATDFHPEVVLALKPDGLKKDFFTSELIKNLSYELDGYSAPTKISMLDVPFPRTSANEIDEIALEKMLNTSSDDEVSGDMSPIEATISRVFSRVLTIPAGDLSSSSDFFELGGDSMGAGRLLNALRKEYPLRLPINILFTNPKVYQLAQLIEEKLPRDFSAEDEKKVPTEPAFLPGCEKTCSSTNPVLMLLQLLPIGLLYPMKRALTWTIFMYMLTGTQDWRTNFSVPGRLLDLVFSVAIGGIVTRIITPFIGIAFKWLIIGRYREGLYPMWGSYHTRWWVVQKAIAVFGIGVFGEFEWSKVLYFRLLGAKIGKNVTIGKGVLLGEYDLLTIGDNVVLEKCIVRGFAAERNTSMYLGRIHIGKNASVGMSSIVAAGMTVPDNACIGPNSSSWEISAADEANRDLAAGKIPGAHWALNIFIGIPSQLLIIFMGAAPWLLCLIALVMHAPTVAPDMLVEILEWFATPYRVGMHYIALAARVAMGPLFFYAAVWIFKNIFDLLCGGPIKSSSVHGRSAMTNFRQAWLRGVMPAKQFHSVTALFGTHYDTTSILARGLGAKVGQRVYWPGTGPSIQDFDLLDIGDDVVFGSRSHLVTSDGAGSEYIRVKSGAMIADRVTLLPGVEVGQKAVMGSGALTKRNGRYAPGTTWVGSKNGEAVCLTVDGAKIPESGSSTPSSGPGRLSREYDEKKALDNIISFNSTATTLNRDGFPSSSRPSSEMSRDDSKRSSLEIDQTRNNSFDDYKEKDADVFEREVEPSRPGSATKQQESSSPFGRAFYEGKASYRVWGQFEIFLYSMLITVSTGILWNVPSISAVQIVARLYQDHNVVVHMFLAVRWWRPLSLYVFFTGCIVAIMAVQTLLVLAFLIAAKWILMGRRKPGNYDWDKSPYCQRWQLFLKLETLRRHCYGGHGILGMLTGTNWLVLYFRALGANIGKDCALFAGGLPSLMFTEPDLLTLGDRVAVDDASLVGHINTRGKFDLNPLFVGSRSVLRSGSRLLSGARMEEDTCLLEHTLVMAGDIVDAGCTFQGWPAEEFTESRMPTMEVKKYLHVKP